MPVEQAWPEHGLKLTECDRGLQVQQDGAAYIARSWKLCDDVVKTVDAALDCGFACVIRHNHPKPNNRDEGGVQYIGFSRSESERWVFVIDQYSCPGTRQRDHVNTVTFEKHYRTTLERAQIPFTEEGARGRKGGQNLFVSFDRVADAIHACAGDAEAVEQVMGAREWEERKAHLGFVTEAVLESYLVQHWHTLPFASELEYLGRQFPVEGGYIDILARDRRSGDLVIVELKRDRVGPEVLGQIGRYVNSGVIRRRADGRPIRGIAIARRYFPSIHPATALVPYTVDLYTFDSQEGELTLCRVR
jgi:hypothetical protein